MLQRYGLGRLGTNTGTSQTALTDDARFGGKRGAQGVDAGDAVMITSGGAAPEDEFSRLSSKPAETTGTMNLDPGLTAALANNDTFEILHNPLVFDAGQGEFSVHESIDYALVSYPLFEKRLVPLTSVTDGDFLASGVGDWTAIDGAGGSDTPTLAKADLTFPLAMRVLRVTNNATGAGDYARSANIAVEAGETYYLEATGQIGSSGAAADAGTLVLYDVTNGASITLDELNIDRFEPEMLLNPAVTMPTGCEQVQIRLTCTAVSDIIEWSNVVFRRNSVKEFTLADRPVPIGHLGKLFAATTDQWAERGDSMTEISGKPRQMTAGVWQYHTPRSWGGKSLWYEEFVQQAALTSDTSTTAIIADHLAAIAAEKLLFPLQGRSDEWGARYMKAARDAAGFKMNFYEEQRTVAQPQRVYPLGRV